MAHAGRRLAGQPRRAGAVRPHLVDALLDAGLVPRHGRTRPAVCTLAQRWLAGELEGAVDVPVAVVCVALNLDATALAAAVRARGRP